MNVLLRHVRTVFIRSYNVKAAQVRLQADRVTDTRFYFAKVPSQVKRWQETGGACILYSDPPPELEFDALLYTECPRAVEMLDRASLGARLAVVYIPPSWRRHEEALAERFVGVRRRVETSRFERMRALVESSPVLTPKALEAALSRLAASRSLSSPGSLAVSARPAGMPG